MSKFIYVVRKNADFTEGRGPMLFHKTFLDARQAHAYIMLQDGIFGGVQGISRFGHQGNIVVERGDGNGNDEQAIELLETSGEVSYNGYDMSAETVDDRDYVTMLEERDNGKLEEKREAARKQLLDATDALMAAGLSTGEIANLIDKVGY